MSDNAQDAVMLVLMFIVFGVPALGITARLAMRPIVDSIVRLRESFNARAPGLTEERIARLEKEVELLRTTVRQIEEGISFDRQLQGTSGANSPLPGSMAAERPPQA